MKTNSVSNMLKNPFEAVNANYLTDIQIGQLWTPPEVLFDERVCGANITGKMPVVLQGGRGSGKTMLLKHLSFEVQMRAHENDVYNMLQSNDYLGVYLRFSGTTLKALSGSSLDENQWTALFSHYYELVLGKQLLTIINTIIKSLNIVEYESILCSKICEVIYGNEGNVVTTIDELLALLNSLQFKVDEYLNNQIFDPGLKYDSANLMRGEQLTFSIPRIASECIPQLHTKQFTFLIDEYENFLSYQQKAVNTFVKHCIPGVSFRLVMRPYGFKTRETLIDSEFLKERDDFRLINIDKVLFTEDQKQKDKYKDFLIKVCNKRLEQNSYTGIDIKEILGDMTPELEAQYYDNRGVISESIDNEVTRYFDKNKSSDEAKALFLEIYIKQNIIVKKIISLLLVKKSLTEVNKLLRDYDINHTQSRLWVNTIQKNKEGILFLIAKKKLYCGFDTYVSLSSGIVRSFLQLCYEAFNLTNFYDEENNGTTKINCLTQTRAAEKAADFFYKEIESIPNYGMKIKSLMDELGALFRVINITKNEGLNEPEPSCFSTVKSHLSQESVNTIEEAIKWSVLHEKEPMKPKHKDDILEDSFLYNRIFCPKYVLAHRTRWPIHIDPRELDILINSESIEEKAAVRHAIIQRAVIHKRSAHGTVQATLW